MPISVAALVSLTELHPADSSQSPQDIGLMRISQELVAPRDFDPAFDRFGSMLLKKSPMIWAKPAE